MRTFLTLLAGWLIGGALIVLLAQPAQHHAAVAKVAKAAIIETVPQPGRDDGVMFIPVAGVAREALKDTFTESRGGGLRVHDACDILAPRGTPVIASVDGTIRKLFTSRAGGLTIYQFDRREAYVYYYAHLDRYADGLREGAFVARGTVIGYVGTTGNAPPGTPHLHFAIESLPPTKEWWRGSAINPYPLLMTNGVTFPITTLASVPR